MLPTITLQDLKSRGSKAIPAGKTVYLIVNSKPKAVLVPPEEYELLLEALEDLEDIQAIKERKHEKAIPFDEVFPKA
jgi:PHD/YefM family antitoxin component YafN of YafNO toxin-antitoxin module